ncbi:MAG: hypothetical protein J3R72DRAFT_152831 [Linnemannia gamsii]|nr:MAG: hypothetical protein J3R72DRAFT_152831 [Linnemannia gamsii]
MIKEITGIVKRANTILKSTIIVIKAFFASMDSSSPHFLTSTILVLIRTIIFFIVVVPWIAKPSILDLLVLVLAPILVLILILILVLILVLILQPFFVFLKLLFDILLIIPCWNNPHKQDGEPISFSITPLHLHKYCRFVFFNHKNLWQLEDKGIIGVDEFLVGRVGVVQKLVECVGGVVDTVFGIVAP